MPGLYQDVALQVTLQATGQLLSAASQQCSDKNTAKQQAALAMVHELQHAILTMLTSSQPDIAVRADKATEDGNAKAHLTVLHEGDQENSTPDVGHVVKMQYELFLDTSNGSATGSSSKDVTHHQTESVPQQLGNSVVSGAVEMQSAPEEVVMADGLLEHSSMFRFEYGGGGVLQEVENAGMLALHSIALSLLSLTVMFTLYNSGQKKAHHDTCCQGCMLIVLPAGHGRCHSRCIPCQLHLYVPA